jgi:hypothetical protein
VPGQKQPDFELVKVRPTFHTWTNFALFIGFLSIFRPPHFRDSTVFLNCGCFQGAVKV